MMFLAPDEGQFATLPKHWANKLPIHSCPISLALNLDVENASSGREKFSDSCFLYIRLRICSWSFPTMQTDIAADFVRSAKGECSFSFGSVHDFDYN